MKTMYRLLYWPSPNARAEQRDLYETAQQAMAAAPIPASEWHAGREGTIGAGGFWTTPNRWGVSPEKVPESDAEKIELAVAIALDYGQTDGDHHKAWVIDQMVRVLVGGRYDRVITEYCAGEDGPDTYEWDTGIAP